MICKLAIGLASDFEQTWWLRLSLPKQIMMYCILADSDLVASSNIKILPHKLKSYCIILCGSLKFTRLHSSLLLWYLCFWNSSLSCKRMFDMQTVSACDITLAGSNLEGRKETNLPTTIVCFNLWSVLDKLIFIHLWPLFSKHYRIWCHSSIHNQSSDFNWNKPASSFK